MMTTHNLEKCPHCGSDDTYLDDAWDNDKGRIWETWVCQECGELFEVRDNTQPTNEEDEKPLPLWTLLKLAFWLFLAFLFFVLLMSKLHWVL